MIGYGKKYDKYIRNNYLNKTSRQMAAEKGVGKFFIESRMKKLALKIPAKITSERRRSASQKRSDTSHDKFIKKNYLKIPAKQMASKIGRSSCFVFGRMRALELKVPDDIKYQFRLKSMFGYGQKMFKHPKGVRLSPATEFKKGQLPWNTKKDGQIVIRKSMHPDRGEPSYKWIRISNKNWKMYHIYKWEKKHGPIQKGFNVIFKDGNQMNVTLKNLELISDKELMERNTINRFPAELKQTIHLLSRVKRKIKKYAEQ